MLVHSNHKFKSNIQSNKYVHIKHIDIKYINDTPGPAPPPTVSIPNTQLFKQNPSTAPTIAIRRGQRQVIQRVAIHKTDPGPKEVGYFLCQERKPEHHVA
jgi:hypothetical protein